MKSGPSCCLPKAGTQQHSRADVKEGSWHDAKEISLRWRVHDVLNWCTKEKEPRPRSQRGRNRSHLFSTQGRLPSQRAQASFICCATN